MTVLGVKAPVGVRFQALGCPVDYGGLLMFDILDAI